MTPALDFRGATVVRSGRAILDAVDWTVRPDERWIVLGRNGSGKTTLLRLASCYLHPTAGTVDVLGGRLGRVDVRTLRARIGLTSAALADQLRPTLDARDLVMTAKHAALEPWWHRYTGDDRRRAEALLTGSESAVWPPASSARCRRVSASACCWPAR